MENSAAEKEEKQHSVEYNTNTVNGITVVLRFTIIYSLCLLSAYKFHYPINPIKTELNFSNKQLFSYMPK